MVRWTRMGFGLRVLSGWGGMGGWSGWSGMGEC